MSGNNAGERERLVRVLSALEWQIKVATERPSNYDGRVTVNATDLRALITEVRRSTVTTVEELDALPELSVVVGVSAFDQVVARKPFAEYFPHAVAGFWETAGSELGTDSAELIAEFGSLAVVSGPGVNGVTA